MDFDSRIKMSVYGHFAGTGKRPSLDEVAAQVGVDAASVLESFRRLRDSRVLVLEPDEASIRMAAPFSGVPTQHVVESGGIRYFANCAWDALGVPAALQRPAIVHSRCEQSGEPLDLQVGLDGPPPSSWLFHCQVPAAKWWNDVVFT